MDEATLKFGLLMESAQAHQKLAETHLEQLRAHTQDLDGVVRDEIRRTLIEELQLLTAESNRAAAALRKIGQRANLRAVLSSAAAAALCAAISVGVARWALPSAAEISALREQREALASSVSRLQRQGGRIELRHCGGARRLCVRVDRKVPAYGENADFYVVEGY